MTSFTLARTMAQVPAVGMGCWKIPKESTADAIVEAIKIGWRHFDCACDYGNEAEVGAGLKAAIDQGLVTREDLWITSKLWCTYHAPENVPAACQRSLTDLGLEYLDLYLVHFPISLKFVPFETRYPPEWIHDPAAPEPKIELEPVPMYQTWGAMEQLVDAGLVKNIGVCNMNTQTLRDMLSYAKYPPQMLQVELHPRLTQQKLVKFCEQNGIAVTGFSPLGSSSYVEMGMANVDDSVLAQSCVKDAAAAHSKTAAQIVLRWGVQRGTAVIPKTSKPERMIENLDVCGFELSEPEMDAISALNQNRRFNDPGVFCSFMGAFCPIYE